MIWLVIYPDGNIEFLGRIDNQVKIRGFRIELGKSNDIHDPSVKEVVVIIRSKSGDKQLVAYFVPGDQQVSPMELRHFVSSKLPNASDSFVFCNDRGNTPNTKW